MDRRNSVDSYDEGEYLQEKQSLPGKWAIVIVIVSALLLVFFASTIVLGVILAHDLEGQLHPKNVILMISDGFGPASETMTRDYVIYKGTGSGVLPLDTILVGASRTRSSDSLVTDSAAGATAFSCALKSYNGAIAVDPNGVPCATVLEAAQKRGMKTGLVATSRITHATPGSFAAHVIHRDMENDIALQELQIKPDLMFGGGLRHFIPKSQAGSSRTDDLNLLTVAADDGYHVALNANDFNNIPDTKDGLPALGLFAYSDMSYEMDRNPAAEPSLLEMATKALSMLLDATKDTKEGFFIMIEGSRIDHAGHDNDAAAHLREILEYQEVIDYVKQFIDQNPNTLLISVSDHETGGLSLATNPDYLWYPQVLDVVQNSSSALATALLNFPGTPEEYDAYLNVVITQYLGIQDATSTEINTLNAFVTAKDYYNTTYTLAHMVSVRAHIGWSTHGHSAVDVNLYAYGTMSSQLDGNMENTDIGKFIINALDLNLELVDLKRSFAEKGQISSAALKDPYHHNL